MAVDLDVAKLEQELQGIYQERQAVRIGIRSVQTMLHEYLIQDWWTN